MSSEPGVPTYILQSDGLFREGLRLILSKTRFRAHGCAIDLEDLSEIPNDKPVVFIVGVGESQVVICSKIRSQYPLAFIVAVADDGNPHLLAGALEDGANAALFNSVSPDALVSTLQAVVNGKLILIDARLWSLEIPSKAEDRPSPPLANEIPWQVTNEPVAIRLSAREIAVLERIVQGDFEQACRAILQDRRADGKGSCEGHLEKDRSEQSNASRDVGAEQPGI